jgi:microcystin-dependent protein
MAEPFLAEIRIMSFVFAPQGWALSNGQLLPINQNQALFSLLGTTFGGDGRVNFALPDLRARTPIHVGSGHTWESAAASRRTRSRQQNCHSICMLSMQAPTTVIRKRLLEISLAQCQDAHTPTLRPLEAWPHPALQM